MLILYRSEPDSSVGGRDEYFYSLGWNTVNCRRSCRPAACRSAGLTILLDTLTAMDLHSKQEDMYVAATDSTSFLTDKSLRSVLPMLHHAAHLWESWSELTAKVKKHGVKETPASHNSFSHQAPLQSPARVELRRVCFCFADSDRKGRFSTLFPLLPLTKSRIQFNVNPMCNSNSKFSATFVGTACPGGGRGRRLPQRMYNTPRRLLLAAAVSSLIWKWNKS